MKKLFTYFIGLIMLFSVIAGAPVPEPFVLYFNFDGELVIGLNVDFTCNGETISRVSNSNGGVQVNLGAAGSFNSECNSILSVDCGYDACGDYNINSIDTPYQETIILSEAPPTPEPECTLDSDCASGYECINEECSLIVVEPEPEPVVDDKVTSNEDNSLAIIESNLGDCVDVTIEDNKLNTLLDTEIDFDGEDYDIHEELKLKYCVETSIEGTYKEYLDTPYIVIPEGGVKYLHVFDDVINHSEVDEEETLELIFLGMPIEITRISDSSITLLYGEEFRDIPVGETRTYNGLDVKVISVNEDDVYLSYNGESKEISKGAIREVGGIEIQAVEVIDTGEDNNPNLVTLRIAEDVEITVDDGDDYNEGKIWKWLIKPTYFGIENQEEYSDLEELDYLPLQELDTIVLPNNYTKIQFNDLTNPALTEFTVRVKDGYLRLLGEREDSFADDYDEIWINAEGIYDEDLVLISTEKVRIGESDIYLELGSVKIGDLTIELDMSDILYAGVSFATKDDIYLDYQGILFKDPEEAISDKSGFEVSVPDERPEVTVTVGTKTKEKKDGPCPETTCPKSNETTVETECEEQEPCKTCETSTPCEVCDVPEPCPDTGGVAPAVVTGIIALLLGSGGMYFLKRGEIAVKGTGVKIYTNRKGERVRQHKHPGTRGYHNPNTQHREKKERHPEGHLDPEYEKDDSGEWAYVR